MFCKKVLSKILKIFLSDYRYGQLVFSQEGEELILSRLFGYKTNGYYVDIGCYNPKRFSNTYSFYLNGWRGINIDANIDTIKLFKKYRKKILIFYVA